MSITDDRRNGTRIIHGLFVCAILCVVMVVAVFVKPAEASAVTKQTYANVVIFAYFQDGNDDSYYNNPNIMFPTEYLSIEDKDFFQNQEVSAELMDYYNGPDEYSMTNYLAKVSDGNFTLKNVFPQYDESTKTITPYCIKDTNLKSARAGDVDEAIIREVMNNVKLPAGSYEYDYNGDGYIDNVSIILRGGLEELGSGTLGTPTLYAHKADYSGTANWGTTGKRVSVYNMLNTYTIMERSAGSKSGVLIHEFLHSIGFPDLYPIDSTQFPVNNWDIMASSAKYPSNILAYMRMKVGGWMDESDIPVISSSQTQVTLDKQDKINGRRAYIIKSPLNNEEFFVVEFRQKPEQKPGNRTIDCYIGGSGIIVYRINPTVENLSNHRLSDKYGVYVFRPQVGYDNDELASQDAFLSRESGRTSMGTADMSKKLKDGAISFSNGENSGIVISNVSSAAGDQITFDVSVPDAGDYDTWADTKFTDSADAEDFNKKVAIRNWNGIPHMAVYMNGRISLWKYADSVWKQVGSEITCDNLSSLNLEVYNGELYLSYNLNGQDIKVKKMSQSASTWTDAGQTKGTSHSLQAMTDGLYMAYLKPDTGINSKAILAKVASGTISDLNTYKTGFLGDPDLAQAGGRIYVSVRDASYSQDGLINVFKYVNDSMQEVHESNLEANTYDMAGNGDRLYVVLGGSEKELNLYTYDGSKWETIDSGMNCFQPKLSVSQGNVYILMTPGADGSIKVIRYDEEKKEFVEEGINIDGVPSVIDFTAIDHKLFVGYVRESDMRIYVKLKESTAPDTGHTHTVVIDPAVPATTTENGRTEGSHCSECGTTIVKQQVVARVASAGLAKVSAYNGKVKTPAVTVKDAEGNVLAAGVDYKATYQSGRKKIGTYKVTITLQDKYAGTLTRSFKINPKGTKISTLKPAKKKIAVAWKKQRTQTTGYQIQYSLKPKFTGAKTITVKKNTTNKKSISKLRSKKYYYVRVRTYKRVSGKNYYSTWSAARKVKAK